MQNRIRGNNIKKEITFLKDHMAGRILPKSLGQRAHISLKFK